MSAPGVQVRESAVVEVVRDRAGTRYRIVLVESPRSGDVVIALPDLRWSYSVGAWSAPSADYLRAHGVKRGDAGPVAAILAEIWPGRR